MQLKDGFVELDELEAHGIRSLTNENQPLPKMTAAELEVRLERAMNTYDDRLVLVFVEDYLSQVRALKERPYLH